MKSQKFLMINIMIMAMFLALSSSSKFVLWISMEINMMSFIPIMFKKDKYSSDSMIMYFIIQAITSSLFLLIVLMQHMFYDLFIINMLISSIMCMKIAAAPFHFWLPELSEGLSMLALSILLTMQKMIPLFVMSLYLTNLMTIYILLSAFIGSLGSFNQHSLRKLMVYSSIAHLSWMMCLIMLNSFMWIIYLIMYTTILIMLLYILDMMNLATFNMTLNPNFSMCMLLMILLLSVGGMPPTMGFMMKWLALKEIISSWPHMSLMLIISSIFNLYIYMRLIYNFMLMKMEYNKWNPSQKKMIFFLIMPQIMAMPLLIIMW
uniref:NADH-ubiquinone oxidoreductase chain 2 n=1 Tax=Chiropterargas boueti TaxID=1827022 RepID=A0A1P8AG58_9ACAR|nr:NADH dehydrogenase subunit 2 [Chiropterargas boueti]